MRGEEPAKTGDHDELAALGVGYAPKRAGYCGAGVPAREGMCITAEGGAGGRGFGGGVGARLQLATPHPTPVRVRVRPRRGQLVRGRALPALSRLASAPRARLCLVILSPDRRQG